MSDPTELTDTFTEEVGPGIELEYEPVGGGKMSLVARNDGDILTRGEYAEPFSGSHKGRTNRGEFLNKVEESLETETGIDAGDARRELKQWFIEMGETADKEEEELYLPAEIRQIVEGTESVEIHAGENTTWKAQINFAGKTNELEFTAGEMTGNGAKALEEKIANQFFEIIEVEKEDWDIIKHRWQDRAVVAQEVEETADDTIADRVLEKLRNTVQPVADKEDMGNDVAAAWYDANNATGYPEAGPDEAILWVQQTFLLDQLEAVGKDLTYHGELVKKLIARGDLHGSRMRKKWAWETRTKVYAFDPEAVGVTDDDLSGVDEPNHSGVEA